MTMMSSNSRHNRIIRWAGACLLISGCCVSHAFGQSGAQVSDQADQALEEPAQTPPTRGLRGEGRGARQGMLAPRSYDRSGSGRSMGRWRNPSDADIALFMEVVQELNPDWSASLDKLSKQDAEAFRKSIVSNGRRLWQLVELREQNPSLYGLRIEEIRIRQRLRDLGSAYRQAFAEGRSQEMAALLLQIRGSAQESIDLQMRVRGEELAAMADALEKLRQELLSEATDRENRAEELVQRLIAPETKPSSSDPTSGRSPGGFESASEDATEPTSEPSGTSSGI
jgi:hypothetical protein